MSLAIDATKIVDFLFPPSGGQLCYERRCVLRAEPEIPSRVLGHVRPAQEEALRGVEEGGGEGEGDGWQGGGGGRAGAEGGRRGGGGGEEGGEEEVVGLVSLIRL